MRHYLCCGILTTDSFYVISRSHYRGSDVRTHFFPLHLCHKLIRLMSPPLPSIPLYVSTIYAHSRQVNPLFSTHYLHDNRQKSHTIYTFIATLYSHRITHMTLHLTAQNYRKLLIYLLLFKTILSII